MPALRKWGNSLALRIPAHLAYGATPPLPKEIYEYCEEHRITFFI